MVPEPDTRVDELRQQLKSLGYLDAGVDRFVLGAASDTRGPVSVAARTSVRVGLLGGALLGPAAAIGLAARLQGLVSGVRDASVLALYLAVFFGAAVGLASLLVSLAAASFAPARAKGASRAAAWVFAVGSLFYLTLWWRNANAGFGWSAPILTAFALVVAVAISLLLGHAVRIATLAVVAARGAGAALPPIPARSWTLVAAGGALAFTGASVLLLATVSVETDAASATPPLTVINSWPVRLVAIDGFDPETYARLKDRLPNLKPYLQGFSIHLEPQDTSDPARAWTTIATGVPPDIHGVHAMETRRVAGLRGALSGSSASLRAVAIATDVLRLTRPSLTTSEDRKVKTLWEVAEGAGLRTAVVNWWATWPAPTTSGLMITDRGILRLEHGDQLDGEIGPPALYESLRSAWPSIRERARARAAAHFTHISDRRIAETLLRSAELDETVIELLGALPGPNRDLDVIYLPGLDIAQNSLLGNGEALSASSVASKIEALESYYVYLDGAVATLLPRIPPFPFVILVTQPGRVHSTAGGFLAFAPTGFNRDALIRPASPGVVDIAPTVLQGLGLPLSRELAGMPLVKWVLSPKHINEDRFVPTYGRPVSTPVPRQGKPLDQEAIDRLRSLGYVK